MNSAPQSNRSFQILPALRTIQNRCGYLSREELRQFSEESGIPLYRLQEVASFFPHFRLTTPPRLTLRVCRDMACHMAGSGEMLRTLKTQGMIEGAQVEGVSCLGRCDRAPAACISIASGASNDAPQDVEHHENELLYLGRSLDEIREIVRQCMTESPPEADRDADLPYRSSDWQIDPYGGRVSDYAAVRKLSERRDLSLDQAGAMLTREQNFSMMQVHQFREACRGRMPVSEIDDLHVAAAVRAWQLGELGGKEAPFNAWSDKFFDELDRNKADLRGLGGAGIPATQKWKDVRDAVRSARRRGADDDRAYIIVNGDESEPATFKDRELLLRAPHLIVEGAILAALITDATEAFIYIRHEYSEQIQACRDEIARAEKLGMCGPNASAIGRSLSMSVFVSPGGYICGEQSALVEAMSDRRGEPRNMPPKLETNGLDDRPTLVSNVETFAWAPYIWLSGGEKYASLGLNTWRGKRFFSVCGDVERPGVYEVPMGLTLRELIYGEQYCRGIKGGKKLKAIAPSGPSGGFLPARLSGASLPPKHTTNKDWIALAARRSFDPSTNEVDVLDLELELALFRSLSPTQQLGAGLVVYAEHRDMVQQAVNAVEFFRSESCGKCVPCRVGSRKLAALGGSLLEKRINRQQWDQELRPIISELAEAMNLTSICGLGRAVPVPLRTAVDFFEKDLARHVAPQRGSAP
jgi:formate dehydrogenase beta subunit